MKPDFSIVLSSNYNIRAILCFWDSLRLKLQHFFPLFLLKNTSIVLGHYYSKGRVPQNTSLTVVSVFLFFTFLNKQKQSSTKQSGYQRLFDTQVINHAVTWCSERQLASIVSCYINRSVPLFVRSLKLSKYLVKRSEVARQSISLPFHLYTPLLFLMIVVEAFQFPYRLTSEQHTFMKE
jgi:hypothetical protein